MFLTVKFFLLFCLILIFIKVYSIFYLVIFFEVFRLIKAFLLLFTINNVLLIFYLFLGFLVVEAAINFTLMIVFSRRKGRDKFFSY